MNKNDIMMRLASVDDVLYTKDAARIMDCSAYTIQRHIKAGLLRYTRDNHGHYIFAKQWVLDYAEIIISREQVPGNSVNSRGLRHSAHIDELKHQVLEYCCQPRTISEITALVGYSDKAYTMRVITRPLLASGALMLTIPDRPHHPGQRYISCPDTTIT